MQATRRLATFVEGTRFETLSADVVEAARRAVLDTLGVTVAGALEPGSRMLVQGLPPGEATVLGTALRAPPAQAALANGALGHALDFDDVSDSMRGHPSIPVLPAALALAERDGLRGRDLLAAFAVGFEVECRLGRALGASSYARGWHATSVLGALGAAAAGARLLGLDSARTRHAFGIAASMASGTRQNFGTMTKPLHAGLAARAGVEAAELAARGFTADPDVVDAPLGFGALFSPGGDFAPGRLGDPGKPWEIVTPGLSVKKYPCCFMTHAALDAALAATGGRALEAGEVASIEVRVAEGSTSALIHHRPATGLEGKFSMEYCVAAAVLDGGVRLRTFDDERVARSGAQSLLRRVKVAHPPATAAWRSSAAAVTVHLRDGRALAASVEHERGSPADPLTLDELTAKYRDCTARVLAPEQVDRSLALLEQLPDVSVRELTAALAGPT